MFGFMMKVTDLFFPIVMDNFIQLKRHQQIHLI